MATLPLPHNKVGEKSPKISSEITASPAKKQKSMGVRIIHKLGKIGKKKTLPGESLLVVGDQGMKQLTSVGCNLDDLVNLNLNKQENKEDDGPKGKFLC